MEQVIQLMQSWQSKHDEPVNLFDRKAVKYYVEYDSWDDRFRVDSCVGYVNFGMVYFSSKQKAQAFLNEHESDLKDLIKQIKKR